MNPTEEKIMFISQKFKYTDELKITDMIEIWKQKLNIETQMVKESIIIVLEPLDKIYEYFLMLKEDEQILTDCRFFAMVIGCLKQTPNISNIVIMHLNMNTSEFMIPENCTYITLDTDKFIISKNKEKPTFVAQGALKSDQGQWICKWFDNKYIGIVTEGALILDISEWENRYITCIKTIMENYKPQIFKTYDDSHNSHNFHTHLYKSILYSLIKLHGICISGYKFNHLTIEKVFEHIHPEVN
tara:strand:+ start:487 stop:1215 length:729 start_codon:yes stop_codon:yes gene_type:complete